MLGANRIGALYLLRSHQRQGIGKAGRTHPTDLNLLTLPPFRDYKPITKGNSDAESTTCT